MTTDNETEVATEERKNRDINEILNLSSWDDLNDAEVRTLVSYKETVARTDADTMARKAYTQQMYEESALALATVCEATESVLESLISTATNYQGVAPTAVASLLETYTEV